MVSAYEEFALKALREAGYRITMPRVQVIRVLAGTKCALSAYAIHEMIISGGGKIDVVSVYRILSTLQEVGVVMHIGVVDGYFPQQVAGLNSRCTEVIVNEETNDVVELKLPQVVKDEIGKQAAEQGFDISTLKIEIVAKPK